MKGFKPLFPVVIAGSFVLATTSGAFAQQYQYQGDPGAPPPVEQGAQVSPEQLQQLVAPIALYPDELVAQVLAAATYPDQVVQADRWMQQHQGLQGDQLGQEVDQQPWDPSVKALTEFPSVLANMDRNLSWTSSLGDAEVNQPQDVMAAVQTMRQRAMDAGNLTNTPQQRVAQDGANIVIEPASTQVVYVPTYDPWLAYGSPVVAWPGWYSYPGLFISTPGIRFSVGFGVGYYGGYGWGWHHWSPDWHRNVVVYNRAPYVFHSRTFVNRPYYVNRTRVYDNHVRVYDHRDVAPRAQVQHAAPPAHAEVRHAEAPHRTPPHEERHR